MSKTRSVTLIAAVVLSPAAGVASAVPPDEESKLTAWDGEALDGFGNSVAIDGTTAIVGAQGDDDGGTDAGAAYLYDISNPLKPSRLARLTASDGIASDMFGRPVAIDGTTVLVGALSAENGPHSGSAYLFDISNPGTPVETKLVPSDGAEADRFGSALAVSGTSALVGAHRDDDKGTDSGSAYLFDFSNPAAVTEAKFWADDTAANDGFGRSVAAAGTLAVVGAWLDDDNGSNSGSAYLFDISDPAAPVQLAKLTASNGAADDYFGQSVAISGNTIIIGAPFHAQNGNDSGCAYVYDISDPSNPVETALDPSDGAASDRFGHVVAINGTWGLVGALLSDDHGPSSGSAYVFDLSSPHAPAENAKLMASDGAGGDYLGNSLGISGTTALVGAPNDDDLGSSSGSAYLFDANPPCAKSYCTTRTGSPKNKATVSASSCDLLGDITLTMAGAIQGKFCCLMIGNGSGKVTDPPGAKGDLCLSGGDLLELYALDIGKTTGSGTFALNISNSLSGGTGFGIPGGGGGQILSGDTWNFQFWYRAAYTKPSRYSEAIRVTFE